MDLAAMREQYGPDGLRVQDLLSDPIDQFHVWFEEWAASEPFDANVAIVATVDPLGWPEARAVLLKGLDERGFVFFSNHSSAKGEALRHDPRVALTFVWREIERQVRVVGEAEQLPGAESDAYFASRPRGAQIGAWASPQSMVIEDRGVLETRRRDAEERYPDVVPRPPHWGGYLVRPHHVEFWQGRPDRLHDRLRYRRRDTGEGSPAEGDVGKGDAGAGSWVIERLAP